MAIEEPGNGVFVGDVIGERALADNFRPIWIVVLIVPPHRITFDDASVLAVGGLSNGGAVPPAV